mgnify:CR=1 FL=1
MIFAWHSVVRAQPCLVPFGRDPCMRLLRYTAFVSRVSAARPGLLTHKTRGALPLPMRRCVGAESVAESGVLSLLRGARSPRFDKAELFTIFCGAFAVPLTVVAVFCRYTQDSNRQEEP